MNVFYEILYFVGFTPWERAASHPAARKMILELFDNVEAGRERPFGKALDIGSGRGHWSAELACRGWEVTGVDLTARAVEQAKAYAAAQAADVRFLLGDITALDPGQIGNDYKLIWDFGTVHGLSGSQQKEVGRGVSSIAAEDAVILMMAWTPAIRGPLPSGMSVQDVEKAYDGWKVKETVQFDASGLPKPLRAVDPKIYRLVRS